MKKIVLKILVVLTLACLLCCGICACSCNGVSSSWSQSEVTLRNPGEVSGFANGGFVRETENYIYYINGIGTSTDDNTYGNPVKGSLMAVEKNPAEEKVPESCIVVPKLLVSTDYDAGFYIFKQGDNNYVYYATPCTEKNLSDEIQNSKLTFFRTNLNGSGETTEYFTVDSLSTSFRMAQDAEGNVYIVYVDTSDSSNTILYSYNTTTKTKNIIAQSSESKVTSEALDTSNYKFIDNDNLANGMVVYATTSYIGNQIDGVTRSSQAYNKVYVYKAGDTVSKECSDCLGTCVLNNESVTNTLSFVKNGILFYSIASATSSATDLGTYAVKFSDVNNSVRIYNTDEAVLADTTIWFNDKLDEVYYYDSDSTKIVRTSLTDSNYNSKTTNLTSAVSTISTLVKISADKQYAYYYNSSDKLCRIYIGEDRITEEKEVGEKNYKLYCLQTMEQLVSEDTVATAWYEPVFTTLNKTPVVIYLDNSTTYGQSYVKLAYLSNDELVDDYTVSFDNPVTNIGVKTYTGFHFGSQDFLSFKKITKTEKVAMINAQLSNYLGNALSDDKIELDAEYSEDGMFVQDYKDKTLFNTNKNVEKAKQVLKLAKNSIYFALSESDLDSTTLSTLTKYEKVVKLINEFKALKDIDLYANDPSLEIPQTLKDAYKIAKADVDTLTKENGGTDNANMIYFRDTYRDLIDDELVHYYLICEQEIVENA